MTLKDYQGKRRFGSTPEPAGEVRAGDGPLRFVIQCHAATRDHYDVRLEVDGVMKSWAVPKGPSLNPNDQRLAVLVEDHPLDYNDFEGVIPPGNYGAGTVMIWDRGTYVERSSTGRSDSEAAMRRGLAAGHATIVVSGHKLAGEFALVQLTKDRKGKSWLLLKKRDQWADYRGDVLAQNRSVATGRTMAEIAAGAEALGEVWRPGKGPDDPAQLKRAASAPVASKPEPRARKAAKAVPPPPAPVLTLAEAPAERLPRLVKPMQHSRAAVNVEADGWLFEPCIDGVRTLAIIDGPSVQLRSRQGLTLTSAYPTVVQALRQPPGQRLVVDGEIALAASGQPVYWVYDLLHENGKNLRGLPLATRKEALAALALFGEQVRTVAHVVDDPDAAAAAAADLGFSGIAARHGASVYTPGVSRYWLKPEPAAAANGAPSVHLTHLDRVYFPADGLTKGDLIDFYRTVASYLLPHLVGRPQSLHRHPHGIAGEGFFQKDMSGFLPSWAATVRVDSASSGRSIDYLLCQNEATLLYMANLGCIELNPWLSRVPHLDQPDFAVIDLDPAEQTYADVVAVALAVRDELDRLGAVSCCKTSGASGMHIGVPLQAGASYDEARAIAEAVCRAVERRLPELTTTERQPGRRQGKLYLDYMQNRRSQTLAAAYCVRPRPGAPVSAPLAWDEVRPGLDPLAFTVRTMPARLAQLGDLWRPMLDPTQSAAALLARLPSLTPP